MNNKLTSSAAPLTFTANDHIRMWQFHSKFKSHHYVCWVIRERHSDNKTQGDSVYMCSGSFKSGKMSSWTAQNSPSSQLLSLKWLNSTLAGFMFVDSAVGQDLNVTLTRGEIGSSEFAELSLFPLLPFSRFPLHSRSVAGALPTLGCLTVSRFSNVFWSDTWRRW